MKAHLSISLLISTYNWPEALELCLESALQQSLLPNEIIIADDGSKDDTKNVILGFQKKSPVPIIHVWHEDDGFRKSIVMNKAVKASSCNYLIMTDGDIILHKHFIADHAKVAQSGFFVQGSRALLNEAKSLEVRNTKQIQFKMFEKGIEHKYNAFRLPFLSTLLSSNPNDPRSVKGCNVAMWKIDYIACNGYNNDIQGWGHEDIELAARLINNNIKRKKIKFIAICYHIFHKLQSRSKEETNLNIYNLTVNNKTKQCENGYNETIGD